MILQVGSLGAQVGGGTPSANTVVDTVPKSSRVTSRARTVTFTVFLLVREAHRITVASGSERRRKCRVLFRDLKSEQR